MRRIESWAVVSLLVLTAAAGLLSSRGAGAGEADPAAGSVTREVSPDPLAALGFTVTGGAAPGYLEDRACSICHNDLYRSYQAVGMARSFYRPRPDRDIEDFGASFFHPPSQRHYRMVRDGDRLVFRRWQLDADGGEINVLEQEVDWVVGSGNHSRVYLFRTAAGELFQLPLAWYTQTGSWGMAPGFDRPRHLGVARQVRRECMFCHNAYPDVAAGSDAYGAVQVYPEELPEGVGCQRCHGPGAEHVRTALAGPGEGDAETLAAALRSSIVNPARLEPRRRDEICWGCHLQPSVALPRVRRFGRPDYSFRPGEALSGYVVMMDVDQEGQERSERFEINHHPYRLMQSRCFQQSEGRLSCLTCHDPHRKVPATERAAHYRAACTTCHQLDDCRLEAMAVEERAALPAVDAEDCVGCHMPEHRTQDVVRVTMTDHLIRRRPGGPELLAPRVESDPVLVGVEPLWPEQAPGGALGEVYRAVAVMRAGGNEEAVAHLERMLGAAGTEELDPWFELAKGQLGQRRLKAAETTLGRILDRSPSHPLALEWLAMVRVGQGRRQEAVARFREALASGSARPELWFNLGRVLLATGPPEEAAEALERVVALRPNLSAAWLHLGDAHLRLERPDEAAESWRRALALEPTFTEAYLRLGRLLLETGQRTEALRWLRHGARAAEQPEAVAELLAEVEGESVSPSGAGGVQ